MSHNGDLGRYEVPTKRGSSWRTSSGPIAQAFAFAPDLVDVDSRGSDAHRGFSIMPILRLRFRLLLRL
jgi:hypothetical protein